VRQVDAKSCLVESLDYGFTARYRKEQLKQLMEEAQHRLETLPALAKEGKLENAPSIPRSLLPSIEDILREEELSYKVIGREEGEKKVILRLRGVQSQVDVKERISQRLSMRDRVKTPDDGYCGSTKSSAVSNRTATSTVAQKGSDVETCLLPTVGAVCKLRVLFFDRARSMVKCLTNNGLMLLKSVWKDIRADFQSFRRPENLSVGSSVCAETSQGYRRAIVEQVVNSERYICRDVDFGTRFEANLNRIRSCPPYFDPSLPVGLAKMDIWCKLHGSSVKLNTLSEKEEDGRDVSFYVADRNPEGIYVIEEI